MPLVWVCKVCVSGRRGRAGRTPRISIFHFVHPKFNAEMIDFSILLGVYGVFPYLGPWDLTDR